MRQQDKQVHGFNQLVQRFLKHPAASSYKKIKRQYIVMSQFKDKKWKRDYHSIVSHFPAMLQVHLPQLCYSEELDRNKNIRIRGKRSI